MVQAAVASTTNATVRDLTEAPMPWVNSSAHVNARSANPSTTVVGRIGTDVVVVHPVKDRQQRRFRWRELSGPGRPQFSDKNPYSLYRRVLFSSSIGNAIAEVSMRIGLTGGASSTDRIVKQAQKAEAEGFTSLWFASTVAGDPLAALAVAGRETGSIELGTAVLQTYPCHPLLQANRAAAVAEAMGRPGFTLGLGPS